MHSGLRSIRIAMFVGLLNSFAVAALTQSRTLFESGLVGLLAAAALIAQALGLYRLSC